MTPLEALGLAADADERAIKREYARRLKDARPDEDPDAFQSLQQVYAQALDWVRNPSAFEAFEVEPDEDAFVDGGEGAPEVAIDPAFLARYAMPLRVETRPAEDDFDLDGLCDAIAGHGRQGDAAGLRTRLANDPALWSLERKAWLGESLLARLEQDTPPIAGDAFDVVVEFFRADASLNPYETWRRLRLRNRMHVAFVLQEAQSERLAEHLARRYEARIPGSARWKRRWLLHARTPWQRQLLALVPFVPTQMRTFLLRLDEGRLDDFPPPIDPVAVAFWDKAGDLARISFVRLGVGASRVLALALIAFSIAWFQSEAPGSDAVPSALAAALGAGGAYAVIVGLVALLCWQTERRRRQKEAEAAEAEGRFPWWWAVWLLVLVAHAIRTLAG